MITKIKGHDSPDDQIVLLDGKALKLSEIFELLEAVAENELNRIRVPKVRKQIIDGERPFMFEKAINDIFRVVKLKHLNLLKGGVKDERE